MFKVLCLLALFAVVTCVLVDEKAKPDEGTQDLAVAESKSSHKGWGGHGGYGGWGGLGYHGWGGVGPYGPWGGYGGPWGGYGAPWGGYGAPWGNGYGPGYLPYRW